MVRELAVVVAGVVLLGGRSAVAEEASGIGRRIFFDTELSEPRGQGCVSCHQPAHAFADPRPVSPGAVPGRMGTRNAPSLMYAALIPGLAYEEFLTRNLTEGYAWEGGLFHDGRARDLFDQVRQPFFDPREMNLPDAAALASRLRASAYADEFRSWVGEEVWSDDAKLNYNAFRALVEFLKEPMFRPFDSRFDDYRVGKADALNAQEKRGMKIFEEAGRCADCHFLEPTNWEEPLLSDFGYDNIGGPSRREKDPGLGGRTGEADELGQFRAPSLRNVALTAPYLHNGSIATLREVVEFYNKRDVEPGRWGATDYPETVNREDMGNLQLTDEEVADLTAFMESFTDRSLLAMKEGEMFPAVPEGVPSSGEKRFYFPDWTHRMHPLFPGVADREEERAWREVREGGR